MNEVELSDQKLNERIKVLRNIGWMNCSISQFQLWRARKWRVISGLFVQYITSRWQHRSWIFQHQYTAETATFEKELDQKHKLLEDQHGRGCRSGHSRFVLAAYVKSVSEELLNQQMSTYNDCRPQMRV